MRLSRTGKQSAIIPMPNQWSPSILKINSYHSALKEHKIWRLSSCLSSAVSVISNTSQQEGLSTLTAMMNSQQEYTEGLSLPKQMCDLPLNFSLKRYDQQIDYVCDPLTTFEPTGRVTYPKEDKKSPPASRIDKFLPPAEERGACSFIGGSSNALSALIFAANSLLTPSGPINNELNSAAPLVEENTQHATIKGKRSREGRPRKFEVSSGGKVIGRLVDEMGEPVTEEVRRKYPSTDPPKDGRVKCPECDLTFQTLHGLLQHFRPEHLRELFQCNGCGSHFPQASVLRRHYKKKHEKKTNSPSTQSGLINNGLNSAATLVEENTQHATIKGKRSRRGPPTKLQVASSDGNVIGRLIDEMGEPITEEDVRSYPPFDLLMDGRVKCREHDLPFQFVDSLYKHFRAKHFKQSYQCNCCGRRFPTAGGVRRHYETKNEKKKLCRDRFVANAE